MTLVELLVVMGVMTVLVSLLMPAISQAIKFSHQVTCLANLRQLGFAIHAYATQDEGQLPIQPSEQVNDFANPAVAPTQPSFLGLLLPLLNRNWKVLNCPDAWEENSWSAGYGPSKYSSTNYMGNGAIVGKHLPNIHHPSETVLLQEDKMLWDVCWLGPAPIGTISGGAIYTSWHWNGDGFGEEYTANHYSDTGGNLLFADCHGEFRDHTTLFAYNFGLAGGPGVNGQASDPDSCGNYNSYYGNP